MWGAPPCLHQHADTQHTTTHTDWLVGHTDWLVGHDRSTRARLGEVDPARQAPSCTCQSASTQEGATGGGSTCVADPNYSDCSPSSLGLAIAIVRAICTPQQCQAPNVDVDVGAPAARCRGHVLMRGRAAARQAQCMGLRKPTANHEAAQHYNNESGMLFRPPAACRPPRSQRHSVLNGATCTQTRTETRAFLAH